LNNTKKDLLDAVQNEDIGIPIPSTTSEGIIEFEAYLKKSKANISVESAPAFEKAQIVDFKEMKRIAESAPSVEQNENQTFAGGLVSLRTKTRRARRRNRLSYASRVIMGLSLALFICNPVLSISLWSPSSQSYFIPTRKAFKNGDIIKILIQENSSADQQWTAQRDKQWQVAGTTAPTGDGAGNKNLFGRFFPFMGLDYQSQFQTDNQSDRSTNLSASVAAEVVNVMPNGNIQIIARKVIRVNSEEQLIELMGNIRPEDVSENNIVLSSAIADATIKVNGTLRYMNDQKPSPLERIFSFVSGLFL